jgi:hypothetical protein
VNPHGHVAHDVLSVARMRSATAANTVAPAGIEPASRWASTSRSTGELQEPGRSRRDSNPQSPERQSGALAIAPRLQNSTPGDQRWHGERMTPPPGSRVISCEHAIRPPAITMARVACDTHASIGCQRAGAPFQDADRPTRRHARRWGDLASPSGDGRGPWTSRPWVVPSRLHAVVPRIP